MVRIVKQVGLIVIKFKASDRLTINVETFCGECFFYKNGYVNNCENVNGSWVLGC